MNLGSKWILGFALIGASSTSLADQRVKVIKDIVHKITVQVQPGDVRCSNIGYGTHELKMSVPDLKWISQLDHTNPGELQPCMTAGRCRAGNQPDDLIAGQPGPVETELHQRITEEVVFDSPTGTCQRAILERVEMEVRGKKFKHVRSLSLGDHPIVECERF